MSQLKIVNEIEVIGLDKRITLSNPLRIDITAEKTEKSSLNKCELNIYNLEDSTIDVFEKATVIVRTGYDLVETIFIGDVESYNTNIQPPDKITTIKLLDGEKNLNTLRISKTYKIGTRAVDVLKDISRETGYPLKTNIDKLELLDVVFNFGYSTFGPVRNVMDKIATVLGVTWTISNEELVITKEGYVQQDLVLNISPETGLIGTPKATKIKDVKNNKKNINGLKIQSKVQPKAEVGSKISLQYSKSPDGADYKIRKVFHKIGNWEGEKITTLEVTDV